MHTFQTHLVHGAPDSGALELGYEWLGEGSGPPVLFLSGGPGELATGLAPHLPWARLAASRPILLLNQRGTHLLPVPLEGRDFLVSEEAALDALAAQLRPHLEWAPAINPWQSALDLPLLLEHLGLEQVDVIAHSYGTHLAMAMMKACPSCLGRVVLLGFEGPNQTYKFGHQFLNAIEREGVKDLVAGPIVEFALRWMMCSWLGLERGVERMHRFLEDPSRQAAKVLDGFHKMLSRRSPVYTLCDAASGRTGPLGESDWDRAAVFPVPQLAARLGLSALPDAFREDPVWDGDTLVLTGERDCFTPTSNWLSAGRGFTCAQHIEIKGAYHDTLLLGAETAEILTDWLH